MFFFLFLCAGASVLLGWSETLRALRMLIMGFPQLTSHLAPATGPRRAIKLCRRWKFLHGSLGRLFGSFQSSDFSIQLLGGTTSKTDAVEVVAFDSRCQGSRSFFSAAFNLGNDSRKKHKSSAAHTGRGSRQVALWTNPSDFCKQFGLCLSCFCAVRELCHHLVFFFLLFCTCVVLE